MTHKPTKLGPITVPVYGSLVTYGLWCGPRLLATIRLPGGLHSEEVRHKAIEAHDRSPTIGLEIDEAPFEFRSKLFRARVQAFLS
jgi:hypothetical protein